jgi:hypothetical protein
MSFWTQVFRLPATALVYGLDAMVKTMQIMQQAVQQIADPSFSTTFRKETGEMNDDQNRRDRDQRDRDQNNGDEVRLFEYYILSVKPDEERVIDGPKNIIVTDNMSGEAFIAWVIARYFQQPDHKPMDHDDKKYIRVCYRVACSLPKENTKYQKDQVEVLREIRDTLGGKSHYSPATP